MVTSHETSFRILPQDRRSERNILQKDPSDRNVLVDIRAYSVCMLVVNIFEQQTLNDFQHRQLHSYRFSNEVQLFP